MTSTTPLGMLLHTPRDAVSAHDLQTPVQAVSQQTDCSQFPDRHSFRLLHSAPFGFRPQRPLVQTAGDWQSASAVHDALQALGVVLHRYGKQADVLGVAQVPAPSQVESGVNRWVVVEQDSGMHGVPDGHFWQAPASHLPLVPQVDWSTVGQLPDGSGVPVGTSEQTPRTMEMQVLHAVLQAVSQQTPCAQKLLRHSEATEQVAPFSFSPHEFASQVNGITHWLLFVHAVKQRVTPLQTYGLHGCRSGATHWPLALHSDGAL
jgi:hypothetical protein